jgi:hypothetical protein
METNMAARLALAATFLAALAAPSAAQRPALPPADDQPTVSLPAPDELRRQILARDQARFDLQFGFSCDVKAMRGFVTDNMEFYHDHEGFAVDNGDQWAADYGRYCAERRSDNVRRRRELIPSSLVVSPLPGFGAVASGEHQFFELQPDKSWKVFARARFATAWRLGRDGVWRIARDFSYDHRKVE